MATKFVVKDTDWTNLLSSVTVYRTEGGTWKIVGDGILDTKRMYEIISKIPVGWTNFELSFGSANLFSGTATVENVKVLAEVGSAVTFKLTLTDVVFGDDRVEKVEFEEVTKLGDQNKVYNPVDNVKAAAQYITTTYGNPSVKVTSVSSNIPPTPYQKSE
jgi:hypothetical protein